MTLLALRLISVLSVQLTTFCTASTIGSETESLFPVSSLATGPWRTWWHQSLPCTGPRSSVCVGCPALLWARTAWQELISQHRVKSKWVTGDRKKKKGNILVVLYERSVEPEVERNVLVSFRQALNRETSDHESSRNLRRSSAADTCEVTYGTWFKHDLYVSFHHRPVLQADDCSVIAHIRKHLKTALVLVNVLVGLTQLWPEACVHQETYRAVFLFGTNALKHLLFLQNYFHLEIAAVAFAHTWAQENHRKTVHN